MTAVSQAETLGNCGVEIKEVDAQRIVALNQHVTELLLQLGLGDRMVGTAYADDEIWQPLASAYRKVPVLSDYYPTREQMLFSETDFIVGGFSSAFSTMGVGERSWWQQRGIESYLLPSNCREQDSLDAVWQAINELGRLLQVKNSAKKEIMRQQDMLGRVQPVTRPLKVLLWLRGEDAPYVAGGVGIGQEIIARAGGINIASELQRPWANLTWEAVLLAKPDLIVMVDSNWSPASSKKAFVKKQAGLNLGIGSVPDINMPFSETTAGIRTVEGVLRLNKALVELESR
ncbi:MAG: ABC transporter substrate-binding protein [Endozoicomonas sp.]